MHSFKEKTSRAICNCLCASSVQFHKYILKASYVLGLVPVAGATVVSKPAMAPAFWLRNLAGDRAKQS